MTVGMRIKKCRLEQGLTQTELAERMGYSGKTSVCAAETCGDNITTTKVQKFADALGVSARYLMGYEDDDGTTTVKGQLLDAYVRKAEDQQLLEKYHNVSPEVRKTIDMLIEADLLKQGLNH